MRDSKKFIKKMKEEKTTLIKGLDVGTMYLIGASQKKSGQIDLRILRHAFLDLNVNLYSINLLREQKIKFFEHNKKIYAIGDSAFNLANKMNKLIRRPMQSGIVNPKEEDAEIISELLIRSLLGEAEPDGQLCYYSVPADPIDIDYNAIYHSGIFGGTLRNLGYNAKPLNEGLAVVYSELANTKFTGIGISFGSGLCNFCLSYKTKPILSFATSRSGDWIDHNASQVLNMTQTRITDIKEKGFNISRPKDRVEKAISIYYREMIKYNLENIIKKIKEASSLPNLLEPINIVCSGGTAMIEGFLDVLKEEIKILDFPLDINEILLAKQPFYATVRGCVIAALFENKIKELKNKISR